MRSRVFHRIVSAMLALVLFLEPMAIKALWADDGLPEPTLITEDRLMEPSEIIAPHDYLDEILNLRGRNRNEVELRAWGEWQSLIHSSYLVLDEGATDVFALYDALKVAKDTKSTICSIGSNIGKVTKYVHMVSTFFKWASEKFSRERTALTCWVRFNEWTEKCVKITKNNKLLDTLSFCTTPKSWHDSKKATGGMDEYWRWLKKDDSQLTNAQGIARTVGIGFAIIGTALSAWDYFGRNEDRKVGRWSFNRVKSLASFSLAAAGLIAMFCIPIVGQVLAVVTAIWGIITEVGDIFGEYNKRWKNAYKNSYWYLYENDPEFKSYYDNRKDLVYDEKSANYILIDENYADFKTDKATDNDSVEAKNGRIYIALEKEGVLSSYYNCKSFKLSDYSIEELLELWEMKADYMSWKPTEAEKNKKKSFWDKVGAVFNPKTYISWAGDKIQSRKYNKYLKNNDIEKVYFNPDFVLLKKYQTWITANRLITSDEENVNKEYDNGFYRMIGLRIEQSPFNYIPLVGIDISLWKPELFAEAFIADSFIVGQKEMAAIYNQIQISTQGLEKSIKEQDKLIKDIDKKQLPHYIKAREFLDEFAEAYSKDRTKENIALYNKAKKLMDFTLIDNSKKTPENLVIACKDELEKTLLYEPLSLSQKAAEMVLLTITIKQYLDLGVLMNAYVEEKSSEIESIDKDITNPELKKYIKDGTFLNVEGGGFLDWLSNSYSFYDESEKTLKQIKKEVEKYNKQAGICASDKRTGFLWIRKDIATPPELVKKMNKELESWKNTIEAWEKISADTNVRVVLAEDNDFAEKVLDSYDVSEFPLEPLDPNVDISGVELTFETDAVCVECASEVLTDN